MSVPTFAVLLWFLSNITCSCWTHPLPLSKSRVSVTHYERVPDIVHRAVPYSHYDLELDHPSPQNVRITTPLATFPIPLREFQISDRRHIRPNLSFEFINIPTILASQMKHTGGIAFPDEEIDSFTQYGQNHSNKNYILNPTIQNKQKPVPSTFLDSSSIVFPEESMSIQPQKPNIVIPLETSTTSSTPSAQEPEDATEITFEYDDKKLAAEFLDWIKGVNSGIVSSKQKHSSSDDLNETVRDFDTELALVNSASLGGTCKPGFRADQNGSCRKQFGGR